MLSKLEMPDLLWINVEEGIQRLREIIILDRIYRLRAPPTLKGS